MTLEEARPLAEALVAEMRPYCERIEIAGSIRRKKPEVRDIELVAIPRYEARPIPCLIPDLQEMEQINVLHEWAEYWRRVEWIKPGTPDILPWPIRPEGKYWRAAVDVDPTAWYSPGIVKLDLFLCQPENWGTTLLIRTGSAEFSHALVTLAPRLGWKFDGGALWQLTRDGSPWAIMPTFEEREVFDLLGLEWVEPDSRVDGSTLRNRRRA